MGKKNKLQDYCNNNNLSSKDFRGKLDSLYDLFLYFGNISVAEVLETIFPEIANSDVVEKQKLEIFLMYNIRYIKRLSLSDKVEIEKKSSEPKKIKKETIQETISISPDDVPDKEYDWEYMKLLGIEEEI